MLAKNEPETHVATRVETNTAVEKFLSPMAYWVIEVMPLLDFRPRITLMILLAAELRGI